MVQEPQKASTIMIKKPCTGTREQTVKKSKDKGERSLIACVGLQGASGDPKIGPASRRRRRQDRISRKDTTAALLCDRDPARQRSGWCSDVRSDPHTPDPPARARPAAAGGRRGPSCRRFRNRPKRLAQKNRILALSTAADRFLVMRMVGRRPSGL